MFYFLLPSQCVTLPMSGAGRQCTPHNISRLIVGDRYFTGLPPIPLPVYLPFLRPLSSRHVPFEICFFFPRTLDGYSPPFPQSRNTWTRGKGYIFSQYSSPSGPRHEQWKPSYPGHRVHGRAMGMVAERGRRSGDVSASRTLKGASRTPRCPKGN